MASSAGDGGKIDGAGGKQDSQRQSAGATGSSIYSRLSVRALQNQSSQANAQVLAMNQRSLQHQMAGLPSPMSAHQQIQMQLHQQLQGSNARQHMQHQLFRQHQHQQQLHHQHLGLSMVPPQPLVTINDPSASMGNAFHRPTPVAAMVPFARAFPPVPLSGRTPMREAQNIQTPRPQQRPGGPFYLAQGNHQFMPHQLHVMAGRPPPPHYHQALSQLQTSRAAPTSREAWPAHQTAPNHARPKPKADSKPSASASVPTGPITKEEIKKAAQAIETRRLGEITSAIAGGPKIAPLDFKQSSAGFKNMSNFCKKGETPYSLAKVSVDQIEKAIPNEASCVFHVLDRRINLDNFESNCSQYELLRAWVQDDPFRYTPPSGCNLMDHVFPDRESDTTSTEEEPAWASYTFTKSKTIDLLKKLKNTRAQPSITDLSAEYLIRGNVRRLEKGKKYQRKARIAAKRLKSMGIKITTHPV